MTKSLKVNNAIKSDGFIIKEKGYITKVYQTQGLDLIIEQTNPHGETFYLLHYSNPGTKFFNGLMKFLFIHNIPIPKVHKPINP